MIPTKWRFLQELRDPERREKYLAHFSSKEQLADVFENKCFDFDGNLLCFAIEGPIREVEFATEVIILLLNIEDPNLQLVALGYYLR